MWKKININESNIAMFGYKAFLIKCPNNSDYKGYSFWHPKQCTDPGIHKTSLTILYTNEFSFKLIKYGKGKHNKKQIIDSVEIDVDEFETMFDVVTENIRVAKERDDFETRKPNLLKIKPVEIDDDLLD